MYLLKMESESSGLAKCDPEERNDDSTDKKSHKQISEDSLNSNNSKGMKTKMRKDAKEFRIKSKAPPMKSNSMEIPKSIDARKINQITALNDFAANNQQNAPPCFDYDKFQTDLKSNTNLQKVYLQFIQAYKTGSLINPSQNPRGSAQKNKKSKNKSIHSLSYTEANTQEGPRNTSDKPDMKDNGNLKHPKERNLEPHTGRSSRHNGKVHSLNPSPKRDLEGLKSSKNKKHKKFSKLMKSSSDQNFKVNSRNFNENGTHTLFPPNQKIGGRAASSRFERKMLSVDYY